MQDHCKQNILMEYVLHLPAATLAGQIGNIGLYTTKSIFTPDTLLYVWCGAPQTQRIRCERFLRFDNEYVVTYWLDISSQE